MDAERWRQVDKIFHDVLDLDPREQSLFLGRECAGDASLREEVEALIRSHREAGSFLGTQSIALSGQTFGSFEVRALIGSGGMGDVYRAWDSKLKRDVAIKALPPEFSRDAERISRFQREAEIVASLNHPHIAAIYDLAKFGDLQFLVLELVEGDTLADRVARGPIPIDETLRIARQIAEALEAAHEIGIIHRDLKPANIKIARDGNVKVLDFGLAKVGEVPGADPSNSPTKLRASKSGSIMGTAAYMSPEQAKGAEAGRTADVWAFGCVLYEMLSGRLVFEGETPGEILGGIFKAEPDWTRLPTETPESIHRLLRRCLQKTEKLRLRDMRDAQLEIAEAASEPQTKTIVTQDTSRRRERLGWIAVVALVSLIVAVATTRTSRPAASVEVRLEITTPPAPNPVWLSISPDGKRVVFTARSEGRSQLWLRPLNSSSSQALTGTDGASYPFWSPDSRSVGFFTDTRLKRIDLDSGSIQVLASIAANARGGAWNRDGIILYNELGAGPIVRVAADVGGQSVAVTRLQPPQQGAHRFPQFLPDGRHFLFYANGTAESRGVYVGQLGEAETRRLFDADSGAVYVSSGQLLYVLHEKLFAQDFDAATLTVTGTPFLVANQVAAYEGIPALSVSREGTIVYRGGSAATLRRLVWVNRNGKEIGAAGGADAANPSHLSISSDGRVVAMRRNTTTHFDIWLLEVARPLLRPLSFDPSNHYSPLLSPDGRRIIYSSNRMGAYDLYQESLTGPVSEERIVANSENNSATDWSRDGRLVLFNRIRPKTGSDIWALPFDGERKPFAVVDTNSDERLAQFSPDAKWIAYESNELGRFEIYIQPLSGRSRKQQVTTDGGVQVHWRSNELFYLAPDGRLMAVSLQPSSAGQNLHSDAPTPLFTTQIDASRQAADYQYVVSPDGQRFLVNTIIDEATAPITVILNWKAKP